MDLPLILKRLIIGGVFCIPFIPLIVATGPFPSLFFPYITGKNFAFRIIVELLLAGWLLLALRDLSFRPRRSLILVAVALFTVIVALADIFSVNPLKSIWSNFERMEGLVTIVHLFAYLLVASSVLTTEKLWTRFWQVSFTAAFIVGAYGLLQYIDPESFPARQGDRPEATLGNATYLAGYLLFHSFIAALFFIRARGEKLWQWMYGGLTLFFLAITYLTATRGALVGFVGGALLSALLIALFEKEHRGYRKIATGTIVGLLILTAIFIAVRNTEFVKNNDVLGRLATISATDEDAQARFMVWNMAWQGFKERPILGWGQESFNFVFNTYYDPGLYARESWFDRVHNIFLDWLISAGLLGLLAYLALYGAALRIIWKRLVSSVTERALLTGLLAAYAIHNFFVFDNIVSYLMFFSLLAYLHASATREGTPLFSKVFSPGLIDRVAAPAILVLVLLLVYVVNGKPILAARDIVQGLSSQESLAVNYAQFQQALTRTETVGGQEVREQLVQVASRIRGLDVDEETKGRFFTLARDEMQKLIDEVPNDARFQLFMASLLGNWQEYEAAVPYLERALELSPQKQIIYFEIGGNLLNRGHNAEALQVFKQAYELEPAFQDAALLYAVSAIYAGNFPLAESVLTETFGTIAVNDSRLIQAYTRTGQFGRLLSIFEKRVADDPGNWQNHLQLAAVYLEVGQRQQAIAELQKAIDINEEFRQQGEYFISEIRAGRNP